MNRGIMKGVDIMKHFVRFALFGTLATTLFWMGLGIACFGGIEATILGFTMMTLGAVTAHKGSKGLI